MKNYLVGPSVAVAVVASLVFAAIASLGQSASQAVPRMPDGKPNFTAVWAGPGFSHRIGPNETNPPRVTTFDAKKMPPFKAGGERLLNRPVSGNLLIDDPTALCLPNGIPRQILSPYPQQWFQTAGTMVILYEYMHFFRVIPIGAPNRPHTPDLEPTWMGDAIGWWEGDTLVIDTAGMKEWMLDATHTEAGSRWHSDALHVVERIRWTGPRTASHEITIDDPKIWSRPWTEEFKMTLHPTWKLLEFVCEENNRCEAGKCNESEAQKIR